MSDDQPHVWTDERIESIAYDLACIYLDRDKHIKDLSGEIGKAMKKMRDEMQGNADAERAAAQTGAWVPVPLGTHKLRKPGGDLRGHLTLTPVRLGWLSALDDYAEIVWGTEYRVYRRVASQATEVDGDGN